MHKEPLVTIITATYNGSRYLAQAIESVIAQDYPNKEYLIINDASKDNTSDIIEYYCSQYPWIRSIHNVTNQERSRSRNTGITTAQGKYIAFLDDDDLFSSPEKLSQQVAYMEAHPDCRLLGTDVEVIDEEGKKLDKFIWIREESKVLKDNFLKSNQFIFSTVMAKKADLVNVGGFVADRFLAEDYELWLKLGELGSIANLGKKLTSYRDRANNTSNRNLFKLKRASLKIAYQARNHYPHPWSSLLARIASFIIPQIFYERKAKLHH